MVTPVTNATDTHLASTLAAIEEGFSQGTLVSAILHKKGVARGPADSQIIYGDDFVHVLIWTGFDYKALVERSRRKLNQMWGNPQGLVPALYTAVQASHPEVTLVDITQAIQEIDQSFTKVLSPSDTPAQEGADSPVEQHDPNIWKPLVIDGVTVRGAKVYQGPGGESSRAPVPGTIYLDGVKLGEKILTPAQNGDWNPKQKAKSVAKETLRAWLPVGLYVRYCLDRERVLTIKVGAEASQHAKAEGVGVDPEAIRDLFKVAV